MDIGAQRVNITHDGETTESRVKLPGCFPVITCWIVSG